MKWTVKLIAEGQSSAEHEVITIERGESISPATTGLTIAEGKAILEGLQRHIVTKQVQEHNVTPRQQKSNHPGAEIPYGQDGCFNAVRQDLRLSERTTASVGRGVRQYRSQSDHEGRRSRSFLVD